MPFPAGSQMVAIRFAAIGMALVLVSAAAHTEPARFAEGRARVLAELAAKDTSAARIYSQAREKEEAGDLAAASDEFRQVLTRIPGCQHATRQLAYIAVRNGQRQ